MCVYIATKQRKNARNDKTMGKDIESLGETNCEKANTYKTNNG
jgi:hypothetical protein